MSSREVNAPVPRPSTPLVGGDHDAASVIELLCQTDIRLITLTGPGGVGKTRLALRIAADVADRFTDGVAFAALAPIADHMLVLPTIAQTLGVWETTDRALVDRLAHALADQRLLLILDNFEQVTAAAGSIAGLLQAVPSLKVLVTSRMPLRVSGEQEYALQPLPLPNSVLASPLDLAANPAVSLFVQRTRAVKADFTLSNDNAQAVAEVCRRLRTAIGN